MRRHCAAATRGGPVALFAIGKLPLHDSGAYSALGDDIQQAW